MIDLPATLRGKPFEPSGLTVVEGEMFVVSDRDDAKAIYKLIGGDGERLRAEEHVTLRGLTGSIDLEGISHDGERFVLANEMTNSVAFVDADGTVTEQALDLSSIHTETERPDVTAVPAGTHNAGIEGVAWNVSNGSLFVALERQYRTLYQIDPAQFTATTFFDVPCGPNLPRWERRTNGEFWQVFPDYAGLWAEGDHLYALTRNQPSVLKIDPNERCLVQRLDLAIDSHALYRVDGPFGLAEGLAMTESKILVVLDNGDFGRRVDGKDQRAMLLEFARPPGF